MEAPYPRKLRVWDGWAAPTAATAPARHPTVAAQVASSLESQADQLYTDEALLPPGVRPGSAPEPFSLPWFLGIESQRHGRHGRWIPRLLEFSKHAGETLLGLGDGLGTDWVPYARHGAEVIVCSTSAWQASLVRRNFELRGLAGRFLHADPSGLPLETASIDVVCLRGLLHQAEMPSRIVDEVYRVLRPGGKVLAVAPSRYDIDFWFHVCFPWKRWLMGRRNHQEPGQRYARREMKRLFGRFIEHRVHKRQLRRADVPHLWRWMPRSLLERTMGKMLVLKAFKPVSAAISVPIAA